MYCEPLNACVLSTVPVNLGNVSPSNAGCVAHTELSGSLSEGTKAFFIPRTPCESKLEPKPRTPLRMAAPPILPYLSASAFFAASSSDIPCSIYACLLNSYILWSSSIFFSANSLAVCVTPPRAAERRNADMAFFTAEPELPPMPPKPAVAPDVKPATAPE